MMDIVPAAEIDFDMEESARKSTWDVDTKETTQTPPFEVAIVIDAKETENKREVSTHSSMCN
jgi:hypothetical protein